jgi:hypothetical protein
VNLPDLSAKGSVDADLVLRAEDRVRAGTQVVSVVVAASRSGRPSTHALATAQANVKLNIFGIDVLSPFGIVNLFLIPGAVAVLTFQLLRRLLERPAVGGGSVDLKDAGVLLFVIPIGVLVYVIALILLHWNLRDEAGTIDVLFLFIAGAVIGAITAGAWWLRWWWVVGRKRFTGNDDQEKVLKRVDRRRESLVQPTVKIGTKVLQLLAEGDGRRVACPQIEYQFRAGIAANVRGSFIRAADRGDIEMLSEQIKRKDVNLRWRDGRGVVDVASADATPTGDSRNLLGEKR